MEKKHLRELLNVDQEPFILRNYIKEKRSLLKGSSSQRHQKLIRWKTIYENPCFSPRLCKKRLIFSFRDAVINPPSPLSSFATTCTEKTSIALLERLQGLRDKRKCIQRLGLGFFRSFLKKISLKKKKRKCIDRCRNRELEDNFLENMLDVKASDPCLGIHGKERAGLRTTTQLSYKDLKEMTANDDELSICNNEFTENQFPGPPLPMATPPRTKKVMENRRLLPGTRIDDAMEKECEEDKQFSPVSVLDPPFQDNDNDDEYGHEDLNQGFSLMQDSFYCEIDRIVNIDFRRENDEWRRCTEGFREIALEIEVTIIRRLIKELSLDLILTSRP